jgi:hypothetical protein
VALRELSIIETPLLAFVNIHASSFVEMPLEVLDLLLALLRQCVNTVARLKASEVVKPSDIVFSTVEAIVSPVSFIKTGVNLLVLRI